jgi:membrane fusion protein (multidrug efflux system)
MFMKRLALFLFAASLFGCASPPAAVSTQRLPVLSVGSGTITTYQEFPASLDGIVDVEIRPQVSGTLDRVYVDEGAFVHAGDPLFKINDAPYREKLNNATASLHAAEGALFNAEIEVNKLKPLVDNKIVADVQLATAMSSRQVAIANVEQARADIATARINLGYTLIVAPVGGYIGRLPKKQGNLVAAGDAAPMTTLSDVHEVHAYFAMGEDDFIQFKARYPGATLAEKIKHLPPVELVLANDSSYEQKGKIELIDGQFDKNTGAISFRATFPNKDGLLRAGNTGRVRLGLEFANEVIVPQSATLELQDKVFVFLVGDSNKVSKAMINIAGKSGVSYVVNGGLKPGDQIVYKGFEHLHEGDVIQPEKMKATATALLTHP